MFKTVIKSLKGEVMSYFAPREAQTTIPCPNCNKNLEIARSCHEVFMRCQNCRGKWPLKDFIQNADQAMEEFLENVYCDRM